MKNSNLNPARHFLMLICFLAAPLISSNCFALNEEQEKNVLNIMQDFLTITKDNKEKSFEEYASALMKILETDPKYAQFYVKINNLLKNKSKNANLWGITFMSHKNLMPKAVLEFLKKYNTPELKKIFNQRLNVKPNTSPVRN